MNRVLAGAIAGIAGTYAMTVAKDILFPRLPPTQRYPLPPREITQDVVERVSGPATDEQALLSATVASHFAFGAGCGVLFVLSGLHRKRPIRNGIGFGLGVWTASYLGWLPAAKILTPATRHPAGRNGLMIAVHLVWGAVTGHAADVLFRSGRIYGGGRTGRLHDRDRR